MSHRPSDLPAAALGFFGGAIVVAAILFAISRLTTQHFAAREHAAPAAQHE